MAEFLEYEWRTHDLSHNLIKNSPISIPKNQPIDTATSIQALRTMIFQGSDLELKENVQQDDQTLLKFLSARKFQVDEAYELIRNYYWYRKRNSDIFKDFSLDSPDIRKALENGLPGVLPCKDRKGRRVLVLHATNWDYSYSLLSIYRAILFSLEELMKNNVHTQSNGFVVIVDWTEFPFRQSTNLKPSILKLMIEGLQDCFPARFKGIHFIGQPWYVEAALAVTKPFLKEKIKERIFVHGNNLSTLHELVHKDILPADMGGEQPSYNPRSWLDSLEAEAKNQGT